MLLTVAFGAIFGLVWALIGYALTGGNRDFTSVMQVVATQYEVLVEHKFAAQARELLTKMDPMAAAQAQVDAAREAERQRAASRAGFAGPAAAHRLSPSRESLRDGRTRTRRIPQRLARAARTWGRRGPGSAAYPRAHD